MASVAMLGVNIWNNLTSLLLIFLLCIQDLTLCDDEENNVSLSKDPAGYMRREFSIVKPLTVGTSMQYWQLAASTMLTDDYLRLTPDEPSKAGGVWGIMPCYIRDWEIHIQFKIQGHNSRFFGDGFAFWYVKEKNIVGPVFGSKDHFSGLALFFDTYANQNGEHTHEHPYISAQVNNGSTHYDHDRDGTHSELAGCTSHFRGTDHETHVAIRYLGSKNRLTVQYDVDDEDKWMECLDRFNVELPTGYYFGFSASTGDLSDNHDILSMKFYELESGNTAEGSTEGEEDKIDYSQIIPNAAESEAARDHVDDLGSTTRGQRLFSWFMIIMIIAAISAAAGFIYYQKYKQDQLKRFY